MGLDAESAVLKSLHAMVRGRDHEQNAYALQWAQSMGMTTMINKNTICDSCRHKCTLDALTRLLIEIEMATIDSIIVEVTFSATVLGVQAYR